MTSRMLHRGLAAAFASLVLACGADDNIESSREAVPGAARTMAVTARTEALDCVSSSGACFDVTTNGANITYIFIDACSTNPSDYAITVDGEPVEKLNTNGGPCQSITRDVWFQLTSNQASALVCVSVQGGCPCIQVGAKAKSECVESSSPL
jgi:hypothetical protein